MPQDSQPAQFSKAFSSRLAVLYTRGERRLRVCVFTVRRPRTLDKHSSMAQQPAAESTVEKIKKRVREFTDDTKQRLSESIAIDDELESQALASATRSEGELIKAKKILDRLEGRGGGVGGDGEEPEAKKAKKADDSSQKVDILLKLFVECYAQVPGARGWLDLHAPAFALDSAGITSSTSTPRVVHLTVDFHTGEQHVQQGDEQRPGPVDGRRQHGLLRESPFHATPFPMSICTASANGLTRDGRQGVWPYPRPTYLYKLENLKTATGWSTSGLSPPHPTPFPPGILIVLQILLLGRPEHDRRQAPAVP